MDDNKAMNILILLLGGIPLPNYVAAKDLLLSTLCIFKRRLCNG
jgi:hypothetical protein